MGFARFFAAPARGWWLVPMCGPAGHADGRGARGLIGANAQAQSLIGLYKTELVRHEGPWRSIDDLELATLSWAHWFNQTRLHGSIGHVPPQEYEATHYHHHTTLQQSLPGEPSLH